MSEHHATVEWNRSGEFRYETAGILDKTWISRVTLRPSVTFSGRQPSADELRALHHAAHERCHIANSVKTEVVIEPC